MELYYDANALKKSAERSFYWLAGNFTYCIIPLIGFWLRSWDKFVEVIGDGFLVFLGCALMTSVGVDVFMARHLISNRFALILNVAAIITVVYSTHVYLNLTSLGSNFNNIIATQVLIISGSLVFCFGTKIVLIYIEEIRKKE